MIRVHRLNGQAVVINAELIESIESVPDTVINLYTNNRLIIKESMDEVYGLIMEYKRSIHKPTIDNLTKSTILSEHKQKRD
jgi:flagellar protein FlbD